MSLSRVLVVVCSLGAIASAQDDRAAQLRAQGITAAQNKNWMVAREKFQAAYALDGRVLTLFNLAAAQENTHQLIAARASYAEFVALTRPTEHPQFRPIAVAKQKELAKDIPRVKLRLSGFTAGIAIALDGTRVEPAAWTRPILVDPGAHTFAVEREGQRIASATVTTARGETSDVELVVPPPPAREVAPPPPPTGVPTAPVRDRDVERDSSVLRSPWLWTAVGVLVVGGAVGVYVYDPFEASATSGTLGTVDGP